MVNAGIPTGSGVKPTEASPGWSGIMKVGWWLLVLINLSLYVIAIPHEYKSHVLSSSRDLSDALSSLRLTPQFYAILRTGLDIATELAFTAIGTIIFIRKPRDWMVFLVAVASVTFSSMFVPTLIQLSEVESMYRLPAAFIRAVGLASSVIVFLYLFPDGRFFPRITRFLAVIWSSFSIIWLVFPRSPFNIVHLMAWDTEMAGIVAVLFTIYATGVAAQVYRYNRVDHPVQKQQIKWFLYGSVAGLTGFALYYAGLILFPVFSEQGLPRLLYFLIGLPIYHVSIMMVPLSLAFAISRFHLWDVDLLINRSMVYSMLTAMIIGLYVLAVLAFEQVFHLVMNWERSPVAIALSTLVIAYLVGPLKKL